MYQKRLQKPKAQQPVAMVTWMEMDKIRINPIKTLYWTTC